MGAATMLIGPVLSLAKYKTPPTDWDSSVLFVQDNTANQAIRWLFVGLSIVVIALGAVVMFKYDVDEKTLSDALADNGDAPETTEIPENAD
jgi:Na+/melibiose symporter-like transporter